MSRRPLTVVVASVAAGGGHHTVRDAVLRAIRRADPTGAFIDAQSWTATANYDRFYRWCVRHGLQGLVFFPNRLFSWSSYIAALSNFTMLRDAVAFMRQPPDVVVSTHLVLTAALVVARWWVGAPTRVVGVIPDYGPPAPGFFPRWSFLRPDAVWVNGEDTYAAIARSGLAQPAEVQLLGTLVTEDFTKVRAEMEAAGGRSKALRRQWRDALAAACPEARALDPSKPSVVFYGGSGFAGAARPVVDRLMADPELQQRFNVAVLCGRDEALQTSLSSQWGKRSGFAALGFLTHQQLAWVHGLTDVPVMGSIAHSTLQEMLETCTGPLLVYRCIPGTEPPYLDYLARERLGVFEPDTDNMVALVLEGVGIGPKGRWSDLAPGFAARAWGARDQSRERAGHLLEQLSLVAHRPALPSGSVLDHPA